MDRSEAIFITERFRRTRWVLPLAIVLLVGCAKAEPEPKAAAPSVAMIPGTEVPAPPADFGLTAQSGVGPGGEDVPGILGWKLDEAYDGDVARIYDFYEAKMKAAGWTMRLGESPDPATTQEVTDPGATLGSMTTGGRQVWSRGESKVSISISLPSFDKTLTLFVNACPPADPTYCE